MPADYTVVAIPEDGVRIRADVLNSDVADGEERSCMLRMEIYPLPEDSGLLRRLAFVMNDAARKLLIEEDIISYGVNDLTNNGTLQ